MSVVGDIRIATTADGQHVEVRVCPFCGLKFTNFGVRFVDHWPKCESNDLEPLSVVAHAD